MSWKEQSYSSVTCLYHDMQNASTSSWRGRIDKYLSFHLKNNCSCEDRYENTMQEQSVGTKLKIPIMLPLYRESVHLHFCLLMRWLRNFEAFSGSEQLGGDSVPEKPGLLK